MLGKNLLREQKIEKDVGDLITRIAWLYYMENLTQHEIAKRLFLSRPKVQRLLERAKDLEIVRFQIRHPHANVLAIEKRLIERFGIKDVMVVPTVESTNQFLYHALSRACALYLERLLPSRKETVLGFGWGNTIALVGNYFDLQPIPNRTVVVSLNGHLMSDVAMNPFNSAVSVAQKMQVPFFNIWAPAIAQSKERAEVFKSEPWIEEALRIAASADVLVVSIGEISENASLFKMGFLRPQDAARLEKKNAVGDILGHFLDCKGNIIDDEIHDRVIGIPIDILRSKDRLVIGVAGGKSKYQAIRGAILGGFVDVLITDEDTANGLLEVQRK